MPTLDDVYAAILLRHLMLLLDAFFSRRAATPLRFFHAFSPLRGAHAPVVALSCVIVTKKERSRHAVENTRMDGELTREERFTMPRRAAALDATSRLMRESVMLRDGGAHTRSSAARGSVSGERRRQIARGALMSVIT